MTLVKRWQKLSFTGLFGLLFLFPNVSSAQWNANLIGGFESDLPSYWTKGGEPGGSTLS